MGQQGRRGHEPRQKGWAGPGPRASTRRRPRWIRGVLLGLLVAGGGVGVWQWIGGQGKAEPAPRFTLPASTGQLISLDDYTGKQEVVLLFYMGAG